MSRRTPSDFLTLFWKKKIQFWKFSGFETEKNVLQEIFSKFGKFILCLWFWTKIYQLTFWKLMFTCREGRFQTLFRKEIHEFWRTLSEKKFGRCSQESQNSFLFGQIIFFEKVFWEKVHVIKGFWASSKKTWLVFSKLKYTYPEETVGIF